MEYALLLLLILCIVYLLYIRHIEQTQFIEELEREQFINDNLRALIHDLETDIDKLCDENNRLQKLTER